MRVRVTVRTVRQFRLRQRLFLRRPIRTCICGATAFASTLTVVAFDDSAVFASADKALKPIEAIRAESAKIFLILPYSLIIFFRFKPVNQKIYGQVPLITDAKKTRQVTS
jgi:hypothetical protein